MNGEFGANLLRAMNQRDAWLYPEMAASMDGIPNHFNALLQRRARMTAASEKKSSLS